MYVSDVGHERDREWLRLQWEVMKVRRLMLMGVQSETYLAIVLK